MHFYKKKPVIIQAIQFFDESSLYDMREVFGREWLSVRDFSDGKLKIKTLEGDHIANPGDWIIKGVKGEFYPCKPDIFEMTYEEANAI